MKAKMNKKELKMISLAFACWGILFIASGIVMTTRNNVIEKNSYSVNFYSSKVAESKTNEIKLKAMTLEVNNPLSLDIKDYLENPCLLLFYALYPSYRNAI